MGEIGRIDVCQYDNFVKTLIKGFTKVLQNGDIISVLVVRVRRAAYFLFEREKR